MTNTRLKFIKTGFATVEKARLAATNGAIVFDKQHKIICVEGDVYGGNIADVRWIAKTGVDTGDQTSILHISYADGTHKDVDFSDVASAKTTLRAFEQLGNLIGNKDAQGNADYAAQGMYYGAIGQDVAGANYISDKTNLRDADMQLDAEIKLVNDRIGQDHASTVNYGDTQYLKGVATLTGADKELDTRIKEINARIGQDPGAQGVVVKDINYGTDRYLGTQGGTVAAQADNLKAADLRLSQKISELENSAATYEIRKIADDQRSDTANDGIAAQYGLFKITHTYNAETGAVSETVQEVTGGTAGRVNIPQDFLVKHARMITVVESNPGTNEMTADQIEAQGGTQGAFHVGDKVLEFVVNTKLEGSQETKDQEPNTYLYINVNDLFDSYTGDSADVIDYAGNDFTNRTGKIGINVDQTNNRISATVAQGAIHANELNADVLTLDAGVAADAQAGTLARAAGEVKVNDTEVNLAQINHSNGSTNIPLQVNFYWDTYDDLVDGQVQG